MNLFSRPRAVITAVILLASGFTTNIVRAQEAKSADSANTVDAITRPSLEAKLTFASPGLVTNVDVHEGDHVKAGQILARQDDRQDQAELQRIQLEAKSTAKIDNYVTDQQVKEVQLKRKEELLTKQKGAADLHLISESEVEESRLDVELAKTQVELARLERDQKALDAAKQQIKVDLMQLKSPIDGIVEKRNINPGEMAAPDPQNHDGAIVVVQNDPLWVEMNIETSAAQQLQVGQTLQARYVGEKNWQPAKIIFLSPQSRATADVELVRLELPNSTDTHSGLHMQVKLPEKITAASAADVTTTP